MHATPPIDEPLTPPRGSAAAAPALSPAQLHIFNDPEICACLPETLQERLAALETVNMAGFESNGEPFADYWCRWDLMAHVATLASGELVGFAISGAMGQGEVFLYELYVAAAHRRRGLARVLLKLAQESSPSLVTVKLEVHEANTIARAFYKHMGFRECGRTTDGSVCVASSHRQQHSA